MPSVTENKYVNGRAYYVAFRNDGALAYDFCKWYVEQNNIQADTNIIAPSGISIRSRGNFTFILNFNDTQQKLMLDKGYVNYLTKDSVSGEIIIAAKDFIVLKDMI